MAKANDTQDTTQYGARLDAIEAAWAQFADSINGLSAAVEELTQRVGAYDGKLDGIVKDVEAVKAVASNAASAPLENIGDEVGGVLHDRLRRLENALGIRPKREEVEG